MSEDNPTFYKIGHCPPGVFKMEGKNKYLPSSSHQDQKPWPSKCGQRRSSRTSPKQLSSGLGVHGATTPPAKRKKLEVVTKNSRPSAKSKSSDMKSRANKRTMGYKLRSSGAIREVVKVAKASRSKQKKIDDKTRSNPGEMNKRQVKLARRTRGSSERSKEKVEMSSEKWNAVVFNESGEIKARTMVVRRNQVPPNHVVYWNGKRLPLYCPKKFALVLQHVHELNPLLIKETPKAKVEEQEPANKLATGDKCGNKRSSSRSCRKCPGKVFNFEEKEEHRQVHTCYYRITDTPRRKRKITYNVLQRWQAGVGGGGPMPFSFVDLEGGVEDGEGRKRMRKGDEWHYFGKGLNLLGKCGNRTCVYNKMKGVYDVVIRKGYECTVELTSDSRFECPGCKEYTFTPTNFLVCKARASFRYKKVDSDAVEGVVVESPRAFPKYVEFKEDEESIAEYEYIEARACEMFDSLFQCLLCGDDIWIRSQEAMGGSCNHSFHATCLYRQAGDGCPVCSAPFHNAPVFEYE